MEALEFRSLLTGLLRGPRLDPNGTTLEREPRDCDDKRGFLGWLEALEAGRGSLCVVTESRPACDTEGGVAGSIT